MRIPISRAPDRASSRGRSCWRTSCTPGCSIGEGQPTRTNAWLDPVPIPRAQCFPAAPPCLLNGITCKADAAEHAETWRQKSVRVLVVNVGNVVDPAEQLKLIVECIFGAEVGDGVAGGRDRHACVS